MSRERGQGLIALFIVMLLALAVFFSVCFDDDDDADNDLGGLGRIVLINHEYGGDRCYSHGDCRGEDDRYDDRGHRDRDDEGRRKRTCFFGCDNIIIVPGLPGTGGGEEPPE